MQIYYSHCNCNTIPSTIIRGSVSSFCIQHMSSLLYQIKDPSLFIHICILFHFQLESICDRVIMGLLYMWLDRIYPSKSIKKGCKKEDVSLHNIESEILHIFMQTANTAFNLSSNPVPTIFEVTQVTGNKEPKLLGFIKKAQKTYHVGNFSYFSAIYESELCSGWLKNKCMRPCNIAIRSHNGSIVYSVQNLCFLSLNAQFSSEYFVTILYLWHILKWKIWNKCSI